MLGESRYLKKNYQKLINKLMNVNHEIWKSIFPWQENWPKLR